MRKLENFLTGIVLVGLVCMLIFALTSCSHKGYGCKGNYTWDRTVRKANRLY